MPTLNRVFTPKWLAFVVVTLCAAAAMADELEVRRKTSIKTGPSSSAAVLEQVEAGTRLPLTDNEQTDGYYATRGPDTGQPGFIYRNFVRRHSSGAAGSGGASTPTGGLLVRVVDVGPGLCTITRTPDGHVMVYDAGHWVGGQCLDALRELVPQEDEIDLMIISHSDADHLGQAADILSSYRVRQLISTGMPRTTAAWIAFNNATTAAVPQGMSVTNLQTADLVPGTRLPLGGASVMLVAGWGIWEGDGPTASERLNAVSIVVKLEFGNRSVLFSGDTVGRRKTDPDAACKDAEKIMVERHTAGTVSLKSDVVIAPHHGGNNGSAMCFIEAVDPTFVIFSAGHDHEHPTAGAAQRYLQHGVDIDHIFRTDRGDNEAGEFEWKHGSTAGCSDSRGDDDVDITIGTDGAVRVGYRRQGTGC